jgi:DNA-binding NarL/FixJ family response regulator
VSTPRVLLADDQALLRHGRKMMVDAQPDLEVVGEAADGAEAVEMAALLRPDIVLMDIRMPRMDGVEATRRICGDDPARSGPKVIVLTTFDLDEYVVGALSAGASGFLLKDAPPADIIAGIGWSPRETRYWAPTGCSATPAIPAASLPFSAPASPSTAG